MVKEQDFLALIKVFKGVVTEMAEKDNIFERKVVLMDWIELMGQVDRALGNILMEKDLEERRSMVRDFNKVLKELGYDI